MRRTFAIGFVFLLCVCCATLDALSNDARMHDEDDIREAVFRYLFEHNASGQQKKAGVYCLSLGEDADPSDEFMRRFAGHKPPVRKLSQCTVGPYHGVIDKRTQKVGLKFRVSNI